MCSGIHFRRVLSGMEGRFGQRMRRQSFVDAGGNVLSGDRRVVALAVDVLQ